MTIADGLMIVAVLLAPLIAVQVQKYLERRRESRGKRQGLFEALMATRAARVSPRHVEALNMIELEFFGEDAVVSAWRIYRDHLSRTDVDRNDSAVVKAWTDKGDDLFVDLLYEISQSLGYRFDRVDLKRGAYSPVAHGEEELRARFARMALAEVLDGTRPIPITVFQPSDTEQQG